MDKKHVEGIFNGLWLVGIGIIFLLNTTGVLPWSIWGQIFRFWPVFIIIAGLSIIAGKSALGHAVVGVISLSLLAFLVIVAVNNVRNPNTAWTFPFVQVDTTPKTKQVVVEAADYSGITNRSLKLEMSSGEFTLAEDVDLQDHFTVDAQYATNHGEPDVDVSEVVDKLNMTFEQNNNVWDWMSWVGTKLKYDMKVGQLDLPTDMNFDLSAGSLVANLSETEVRNMRLQVSAGAMEISLAGNSIPDTSVDVNVSAGSLTLKVPKEVGLKISHSISAGSVEVDGEDVKRDEGAVSFDVDAEQVLELDLNVSAGSVEIERI